MTSENIRERLGQLEAENKKLRQDVDGEFLDFSDPSAVVEWFGKTAIRYLGEMRREKAGVRLRGLNSLIDSYTKASRLAHDSSEIESLKLELQSLRDLIIKDGPRGVVK